MSSVKITEEEWAVQLRHRIVQVRSWEDRFAIKNHPVFCQYFKMTKLGVPLEAVKNTIEMDGHDRSIMDLDPDKSLKIQLDLLGPAAIENLHVTGALNESVVKDGDDEEVELSVPETVRKVLVSFRQRRWNQVYAAMALLSESKFSQQKQKQRKKQKGQKQRGAIIEKQSKGLQPDLEPSLPISEEGESKVEHRHKTLSANQVDLHSIFEKVAQSEGNTNDGKCVSNIPDEKSVEAEHIATSNAEFSQKMGSHDVKQQQDNRVSARQLSHSPKTTHRTSEVTSLEINGSPRQSIPHQTEKENLGPGLPVQSDSPPDLPPAVDKKTHLSQFPTTTSPLRRKSSEMLQAVANENPLDHYHNSLILELVDVLESEPDTDQLGKEQSDNAHLEDPSSSAKQSPPTEPMGQSASERSLEMKTGRDTANTSASPIETGAKQVTSPEDDSLTSPKASKQRNGSRKIDRPPPVKEIILTDNNDTVDHEKIQSELKLLINKETTPRDGAELKLLINKERTPRDGGERQLEQEATNELNDKKDSIRLRGDEDRTREEGNKKNCTGAIETNGPSSPLKMKSTEMNTESSRNRHARTRNHRMSPGTQARDANYMPARANGTKPRNRPKRDDVVRKEEYLKIKAELESAKATIVTKEKELDGCVRKEEFQIVKSELESARATIATKDDVIKGSVSKWDFDKVNAELEAARATIASNDEKVNNSVSKLEYEKVVRELESAKSMISSKDKMINDSVRMEDYVKVVQELESAKATILLRDKASAELNKEYQKLRGEMTSAKSAVSARDKQLDEIRKQVEKLVREAESLKASVVAKDIELDGLRRQVETKDEEIKCLKHRSQPDEGSKSTVKAQVVDTATMQAKIDDAKRRQSELREKFISPHRVKKKVGGSGPRRDFEALALSPAGVKRRSAGKRKSKPKEKGRDPAYVPPSSPPIPPLPPIEKTRVFPLQNGTTSPTDVTEHKHVDDEHSVSDLTSFLGNNSLKSNSADDDATAKEVILNLFDSWSSKHFTSLTDFSQPSTPASLSKARQPTSKKTPRSANEPEKSSKKPSTVGVNGRGGKDEHIF